MSWDDPTDTGIRNVHTRITEGPVAEAWRLMLTMGGPDDAVWPADRWSPMVLDVGVTIGSSGGHGGIRYHVEAVEPGRSVRFRFDNESLPGWHELSVEELPDGRVQWTHTLRGDRSPWLLRTVVIPLHDACLEDLLDQVEAAMAGRAVLRRRLSPLVRFAIALSERPSKRAAAPHQRPARA